MPFHENEYTRKGVRRALEYGAGNHFARTAPKTRGGPDPSDARSEQVILIGVARFARPELFFSDHFVLAISVYFAVSSEP